ncbi:hypothetical protein DPMN_116735 [Dreissena polymorpha]|uniref:Uncharacterized protein n=1 Tax=Dreissena polymorpha TaxID=45954 RepID=A0A9D4QTT5_DREPO|nr:hypothetical protein DPMN_116735 [Dreissena polymorpha]
MYCLPDWTNKVTSRSNVLNKFHTDWTINVTSIVLTWFYYSHIMKNAPPPDWTSNVTSRVLTRFNHSHLWENAPPPGGHFFYNNGTIFELIQDIIGAHPCFSTDQAIFELIQDITRTYVLINFHEDRTIHVTSRVLTLKTDTHRIYDDWTINVASRALT